MQDPPTVRPSPSRRHPPHPGHTRHRPRLHCGADTSRTAQVTSHIQTSTTHLLGNSDELRGRVANLSPRRPVPPLTTRTADAMPSTLETPVLQVDANMIRRVDTSNPENLFSMWTGWFSARLGRGCPPANQVQSLPDAPPRSHKAAVWRTSRGACGRARPSASNPARTLSLPRRRQDPSSSPQRGASRPRTCRNSRAASSRPSRRRPSS